MMDIEELIGQVADGWERYRRSNAERIGAALDIGAALIQLRQRLPHGDFLPAIRRLGIADRTARDWMRLVRAGMKTATVADLGGIRAALEHVRQRATTADDARRNDMELENVGLRRQLASRMVDATADVLEMLARLVRLQCEVREGRDDLNERIIARNALQGDNAGLKRERKALVAASSDIRGP